MPTELKFTELKPQVDSLISDWRHEEEKVKTRRAYRRLDDAHDELVERGVLLEDEIYIPKRLIDRRIKEEVPIQVNFITSSDRLLVLKCLNDESYNPENLERAFATYMRYPGWIIPWIRAFDATALHGGCALEVAFDPSKPFYCRLDYIRRDDLMFPKDATSIQGCEHIVRRYFFRPFELETFPDEYNFDKSEVKKLLTSYTGSKRADKIPIYRVFTKVNGIVYVWWHSGTCNGFLKPPEPLKLGIYDKFEAYAFSKSLSDGDINAKIPDQLPISNYPIFWLSYELIEDNELLASRGRVHRDLADQEAISALWTAIINGAIKASRIYPSFINDPSSPAGVSENTPLKGNTIYNREIKIQRVDYPAAELLTVAQQASVDATAMTGRVDFAAFNRRDSRKTAREISAALQQQEVLSSGVLASQSSTILDIYLLCWQIGISQVLLGNIKFPVSSEEIINHEFRFAFSGDTDVIQRSTRMNVIMQTFGILQNTPVGPEILVYLVENFFPEKASQWVPIIRSGDPTKLVAAAADLLKTTVPLAPEEKRNELLQFINTLQSYVQQRTGISPEPLRLDTASPDTGDVGIPTYDSGEAS